jgi:aerobic carbon-monoxide dehydrogenase large subunit
MAYVGSSLRRREDRPLITGGGRFVDDISFPNMLHMAVVRSAHGHARVVAVHTEEARGVSGVVAVITAADLPAPIPRLPAIEMFSGVGAMLHPLLAGEIVRYAGEPIAAVLAEDRYAARDGAERVRVEYEPLPAVCDLDKALEQEAPVVHASLGSNLVFEHEVTGGDVEAAFRTADVVVECAMEQPRLAPVTMECRGAVASYDTGRGRLEVWLSTQTPHGARSDIATVLGIPEESIRVVAPDVGGGFGAKGALYPDEVLAAYLARHVERPVKWVEDRAESFRAMTHGRGQRARFRAAAASDGTVLAVDGEILVDLGAYCLSAAPVIPILTPLVGLGAYRIPNVRFRLRAVSTTQTPTGPYRGAGRPEGAYYIERLMDLIAWRLRMDPADLRRRNFIGAFPYEGATGLTYDSGDYGALLDRALAGVGYGRWREEQARRRREGGRPLGIGLSTWIEIAGGGELWEDGAVRLEPTGHTTVLTGTSPHGQGHETVFSQIVADALGVEPDSITVLHGDTDIIPNGIGTFGSRSLSIGGSAVARAANTVRDRVLTIAAALLEAAPEDLVLSGGSVTVRGAPGRAVTLAQVVAADSVEGSADRGPGITASTRFEAAGGMVPSGAHVAVVEVDVETGAVRVLRYVAVDDCGRVVNPLLVDGQMHGALAQGIAQALFERIVYDEAGQPLTSSLLDYAVPTAGDLPIFETERVEIPSPQNPLGAKGVGESGTTGSPPAIVNAVVDALRPMGVEQVDLPLTPERLWRAVRR